MSQAVKDDFNMCHIGTLNLDIKNYNKYIDLNQYFFFIYCDCSKGDSKLLLKTD